MLDHKAFMKAAAALGAVALAGCTSLGASGPRQAAIVHAQRVDARVRVVNVDEAVTRAIIAAEARTSLAGTFGEVRQAHGVIGPGDVLDVSIWEAPPAVLFTAAAIPTIVSAPSAARGTDLPGQMVDDDGSLIVPFVGRVSAVGRNPNDVAREIGRRLKGKAHDPQVVVRIVQNAGNGVTIVGDVAQSRRMPLTTRGERLLDALASAGGVRQSVEKVLIQITRGDVVASRPLGAVIRDTRENIPLHNNDVITAFYQPYSFQALGAVGASAEVPFEATGITLAQALGRVGGLQDSRANVKGVFVFRFEDPGALPENVRNGALLTAEGKVPVIYRIDLSNPLELFVAQSFPMRNRDVVYVSNAPLTDFQKFASLVSQLAFSVVGVANSTR